MDVRTLRVVLTVSEADPHEGAQAAFEQLSERHDAQAIFQVNRTPYVDDDWGFRITYRSQTEFVQSTSLVEIERAMARVAPNTFERRVDPDADREHTDHD